MPRPRITSCQAAQRDDMGLALGVVLGLLYPSIAVLADLERLFRAGLEDAVLVLEVERNAPLGGPITQKAPHRCSPAASLAIALDRAKHLHRASADNGDSSRRRPP